MFTGIVQAVGSVDTLARHGGGARLTLDRSNWKPREAVEPSVGDSVCVSGVCLTVAARGGEDALLAFDVVAETLQKTTLGRLQPGHRVNLEPAVTLDQPLGGHFMQGHVDGAGLIERARQGEEESRLTIAAPAELMETIVPQGSIAVDGVALTAAAVGEASFEVALIPTTLEQTTLGDRGEGERVNLETDIISKTVVHVLRRQQREKKGAGAGGHRVDWKALREAGFMDNAEG